MFKGGLAVASVTERIQELIDRECQGSQQVFADRTGLTKGSVSQYVNGRNVPSKKTAARIAEEFNITVDWIFGEDEPEEPVGTSPKKEEKKAMRQFDKSLKLDGVCYDVRGPVLDEANRMRDNGVDIIKLNIGNPKPFKYDAPDEIVVDMIYNLRDTEGYSDSKGLFSARKAIMQYCQLKKIPNVTMEDIYTGNGASELITMAMQGFVNNGDEILLPMPDYPLWTASIKLAGGNPVHYRCDEQQNWYPDINDIRKKITPNTTGIVIINPNNPTGSLYPEEVLKQIADIAREFDLMVFADEIYDRLVMDGKKHVSIASLMPDRMCVTFNGLSKSHRIAGYRVGWMVLSGNKRNAQGFITGLNLLSSMRLCSNVPGQSVIQTALGGYQSADELLLPGGRIYEQREFIYKAINDIPGLSAVKPDAAFYIFPKIDLNKIHIKDDEQMVLDFLKQQKVLMLQGTAMNWDKPDHFRIVYLPDRRTLGKATERLADFLSTYSQY
ncbi:MAG: aminotransferase class I/II-fold pyridoxal phosphate-dependent enzyme [Clostridia bacterium]|nr:aminotransferase class I/II-fold pyridoxal phosphate-dependent enzyme [Clostridia bacterium]